VKVAVRKAVGAKRPAFQARVDHWSSRLRVRPAQVRIQTMTRKWASCSSRGCVTFSGDLLEQPTAFQDYVITHELLHLRIRNHGKLFTATLKAYLRGNRWAARSLRGVTK
jgi:predicted metal-dependent hydrolase